MTRIRINYDGWLALPTAVRQKLGLTTGDQLELELAAGIIVLRPVRSGVTQAAPARRHHRPAPGPLGRYPGGPGAGGDGGAVGPRRPAGGGSRSSGDQARS